MLAVSTLSEEKRAGDSSCHQAGCISGKRDVYRWNQPDRFQQQKDHRKYQVSYPLSISNALVS